MLYKYIYTHTCIDHRQSNCRFGVQILGTFSDIGDPMFLPVPSSSFQFLPVPSSSFYCVTSHVTQDSASIADAEHCEYRRRATDPGSAGVWIRPRSRCSIDSRRQADQVFDQRIWEPWLVMIWIWVATALKNRKHVDHLFNPWAHMLGFHG